MIGLGGLPAMVLCGLLALAPAAALAQEDRHSGYYYPEPGSREVYRARAQTLADANRRLRVGFVTAASQAMAARAYAPRFALYAKGEAAEKLLIVGLVDGPLDTLFRARAVLADLTAMARTLPIFSEFGVQDWFTFFDLAKLMGFKQITVSDGRGFAHQVAIE
jgi:hypothetical protein